MKKSQWPRKPYRIRKKRYFLKNKFSLSFILILILLGLVSYLFIFHQFFQVKEIKISGSQKVLAIDIKNFIEKEINKKLLFVSSKSIFLVNEKALKNSLLREFPKIGKIVLKRRLPAELVVSLEDRKPIANWCLEEKCFLIDKEGIIFEPGLLSSFPFIRTENLSQGVALGKKIIDGSALQSILDIQKKFEEIKITIKEFSLFPEKLIVKTSENWEAFFDQKENISQQLFNLGLVLEKQIPLEKRGILDYIDLRFSKIYYKYR